MAKRVTKVKKAGLTNEVMEADLLSLAEQAAKLHTLKALADTDGGKELVGLLIKDVLYCVGTLRGQYKTASHMELVATIASMDAHLATAQLLLNSKDNLKIVDDQLEEALRE